MGHHHHHHSHHHNPARRLGLGGPPGQITSGWPLALALAGVLVAYGGFASFTTYRIYFHGTQAMGVVTTLDAHASTTRIQVQGSACTVHGHYGRVGGMLPVAFPPGRPGNCIVRQIHSFSWPLGALITGLGILVGAWFMRRSTLAPKGDAS